MRTITLTTTWEKPTMTKAEALEVLRRQRNDYLKEALNAIGNDEEHCNYTTLGAGECAGVICDILNNRPLDSDAEHTLCCAWTNARDGEI